MKLSEVIAILEENPKKKFVADIDKMAEMIVFSDGKTMQFEYTQEKNGLVIAIDVNRNWQEVKTPVTFKEAMEGLEEGFDVHCEAEGMVYSYKTPKGRFHEILSANGAGISTEEILRGKWYID